MAKKTKKSKDATLTEYDLPDQAQTEQVSEAANRREVDLLGEMEVSNDVYYGIHTLRAVDNFKISGTTINDIPEFIRGMVQVKKAPRWLIDAYTRYLVIKLMPFYGLVTRFWSRAGAWISSPLICSKVVLVPA